MSHYCVLVLHSQKNPKRRISVGDTSTSLSPSNYCLPNSWSINRTREVETSSKRRLMTVWVLTPSHSRPHPNTQTVAVEDQRCNFACPQPTPIEGLNLADGSSWGSLLDCPSGPFLLCAPLPCPSAAAISFLELYGYNAWLDNTPAGYRTSGWSGQGTSAYSLLPDRLPNTSSITAASTVGISLKDNSIVLHGFKSTIFTHLAMMT